LSAPLPRFSHGQLAAHRLDEAGDQTLGDAAHDALADTGDQPADLAAAGVDQQRAAVRRLAPHARLAAPVAERPLPRYSCRNVATTAKVSIGMVAQHPRRAR
jgi:hypothetical protein